MDADSGIASVEDRARPASGEFRRAATTCALLAALVAHAAHFAHAAIRFEAPLIGQIGGASSPDWPIENAYADFDEDGFLDVASVAPGETLLVLLGRGDARFSAPLRVWAPGHRGQLAAGDFDGDGHADIGYGGSPSMVLFGDGTAAAWTHAPQPPAVASQWTLAGDFDGDGGTDLLILDLLTVPGMTRALLSRPGRTFESVVQTHDSLTAEFRDAAVADLNRDGRDDVVVFEHYGSNAFFVLLGKEDGTFVFRGVKPPSPEAGGLAVGDVNEDGFPDVVMTSWYQVSVAVGLGDGTFGPLQVTGIQPRKGRGIALADANLDGHLDLIHTDTYGGIGVWIGHGNGTFNTPIIRDVGTQLLCLHVADLNGDERPDLIAPVPENFSSTAFLFAVALGRVDGHFGGTQSRVGLPSTAPVTLAGDFDEDGRADIAALSYPGTASLYLVPGRSDRAFAALPPSALPRPSLGVLRSADLDLDGHLDLALPADSSRMMLLFGRGDGTFEPTAFVPAPGLAATSYVPVACGDVTGDGLPDLVYRSGTAMRVLAGLGARVFGSWVESPWSTVPVRAEFADLNGDACGDLLVVGADRWTRALGSAPGTFTFEAHRSLAYGEHVEGLSVMDANGDGRSDVLHAGVACPGCGPAPIERLAIFVQEPDGSLAPPVNSFRSSAGFPAAILAPEPPFARMLVHSRYWGFGTSLETGPARFAIESEYISGDGYRPIASDFDGDGRMDVATTSGSEIAVWFGRDPSPPAVTAIEPSEVSTYGVGSPVAIAWQASDSNGAVTLDLFVSRHGSTGPWSPVALGIANDGAHEWTAAAPYSDSVSFKLVARDEAGNVSHDTSPAMISIVDPVAVESPDGQRPISPAVRVGPNPMLDRAMVRYAVPRGGRVTIDVMDMQGRRVARLLDAERPAGEHFLQWIASERTPALEAGLFLLRLSTAAGDATVKVVVARP